MKTIIALSAAAMLSLTSTPSHAGGILGYLLFGSMDSAQSDCEAQFPGSYTGTWRCIHEKMANHRAGDMNNGAMIKYVATGNMP